MKPTEDTSEYWQSISHQTDITVEFIEENQHKLNWITLSSVYPFTSADVKRFAHKIQFPYLSGNENIKASILQDYEERIVQYANGKQLHKLLLRHDVSDASFNKYFIKFPPASTMKYRYMNEEIIGKTLAIAESSDKSNCFRLMIKYQKLSDELIRQCVRIVPKCAADVAQYQCLNELFIYELFDKELATDDHLLANVVEYQMVSSAFISYYLAKRPSVEFYELQYRINNSLFARSVDPADPYYRPQDCTFNFVGIDREYLCGRKLSESYINKLIEVYPGLIDCYILARNNKLTVAQVDALDKISKIGVLEWWIILRDIRDDAFEQKHKKKRLWWNISYSNRRMLTDAVAYLCGAQRVPNERCLRFFTDFIKLTDWNLMIKSITLPSGLINVLCYYHFHGFLFMRLTDLFMYQKIDEDAICDFIELLDQNEKIALFSFQNYSDEFLTSYGGHLCKATHCIKPTLLSHEDNTFFYKEFHICKEFKHGVRYEISEEDLAKIQFRCRNT
jgi:hypothetical protein